MGVCGRHAGLDKVGQTPDCGEFSESSVQVIERDAELFFDAEGEFEHVERVEAEAAAYERLTVGDFIRLQNVHSEQIRDEMLEARQQRTLCMARFIHGANIAPYADTRHGVIHYVREKSLGYRGRIAPTQRPKARTGCATFSGGVLKQGAWHSGSVF